MHLKNFSLLTREGKTTLAPAYDLLNTTAVLSNPEEIALPLNGKKRNLTKNDLFRYFAAGRLELTEKAIQSVVSDFVSAQPAWSEKIERSFLSPKRKAIYLEILKERWQRMGLAVTHK